MAQLAEGHEIVHAIEQTPNYGKIANMVVEGVFGGTKSSAYISEASRIDAVYKKAGQTLTPEELKQEVVAEYFRTKVFKDSDTLKQFITENYSTLGKDFFANLQQIAGKVRHVFNEKILGKTGTALTPSLSEQILTEFATSMNQARRDSNAQIRSDRLDSVAEGYGLLDNNIHQSNSTRQSLVYPEFENDYDNWVENGRRGDVSLKVGVTSYPLRISGVKDQTITWDTGKINKILNEHPEMNDGIIKQVPYLLENPIVVMESLQSKSRIVMLGELYDAKNNPVLAVLELMPDSRNNSITS